MSSGTGVADELGQGTSAAGHGAPLLEVEDLHIDFVTRKGVVHAVRGLSFSLGVGECLGLVGESGSGKSVSALSLLGLLPRQRVRISSGSVRFEGRELITLGERELRKTRARRVALVFQDPLSSLNPVLTIGKQITEVLEAHDLAHGHDARSRAIDLLELVGIPEPGRRARQYPHELSGGMRQRAMIAMALSCGPSLLIADEPTTALDVTIQAQILELLEDLREQFSMSLLLITHNLGVVARFTERVAVMYAGRLVETGRTEDVLDEPKHPYTLGLLRSVPRLNGEQRGSLVPIRGAPPDPTKDVVGCAFVPCCEQSVPRCTTDCPPLLAVGSKRLSACWVAAELGEGRSLEGRDTGPSVLHNQPPLEERALAEAPPVVEVRDLKVWFPVRGGATRRVRAWVRAVDGVSFSVGKGETLALVGESGSGKTTVGRALVRANEPQEGTIVLDGTDLLKLRKPTDLQPYRRRLQMVFQDPYSSLDPRRSIGQILAEPLNIHKLARGREQRDRVAQLLTLVGLPSSAVSRYPHEFSGGQRQRIGIARALSVSPDLIVCDEPISALDVSIQAQIVNLLRKLQSELGVAYLFIAHDLAVVRHLAHRVAVMYLGGIVEMGPAADVYRRPLHPYTSALLSAIPVPDARAEHVRQRTVLSGELPEPDRPADRVPVPSEVPAEESARRP